MDTPVRISFGAIPSAMETMMEWKPWFNGPRAPRDALVFALRSDYSAVDLICRREIDGELVTCMVNGTSIEDIEHCAWMLAPENTPRYELPEPVEEPKLKSVKI